MKKSCLIGAVLLSMSLYGATVYEEAVKKINMEELAASYSKEKAEASLKGYKGKENDIRAKALLVDLGAVSTNDLNSGI